MTFRVLEFWTDYKTIGVDAEGKPQIKPVDMVSYCPIGKANQQVAIEAVSRLGKLQPIALATDNPAVKMAHDRWAIIKPAYDAWKTGQAVPEHGTPLGAWAGLTKDQANALRLMGIRSVEEIADLTDGIISKLPFPGARDLVRSAKMYLEAADKNKVLARFEEQDAKLKEKEDQIEELRQIILEMQKDQEPADEAPKRRGRPTKADVEVAA